MRATLLLSAAASAGVAMAQAASTSTTTSTATRSQTTASAVTTIYHNNFQLFAPAEITGTTSCLAEPAVQSVIAKNRNYMALPPDVTSWQKSWQSSAFLAPTPSNRTPSTVALSQMPSLACTLAFPASLSSQLMGYLSATSSARAVFYSELFTQAGAACPRLTAHVAEAVAAQVTVSNLRNLLNCRATTTLYFFEQPAGAATRSFVTTELVPYDEPLTTLLGSLASVAFPQITSATLTTPAGSTPVAPTLTVNSAARKTGLSLAAVGLAGTVAALALVL